MNGMDDIMQKIGEILGEDNEDVFLERSYKLPDDIIVAHMMFTEQCDGLRKKVNTLLEEKAIKMEQASIDEEDEEKVKDVAKQMAKEAREIMGIMYRKKRDFWEKVYKSMPNVSSEQRLRINTERREVEVYSS